MIQFKVNKLIASLSFQVLCATSFWKHKQFIISLRIWLFGSETVNFIGFLVKSVIDIRTIDKRCNSVIQHIAVKIVRNVIPVEYGQTVIDVVRIRGHTVCPVGDCQEIVICIIGVAYSGIVGIRDRGKISDRIVTVSDRFAVNVRV